MAQAQQISGGIVYKPQNTKRAVKNILLVIAAATLIELLLILAAWLITTPIIRDDSFFLNSWYKGIVFSSDGNHILAFNEYSFSVCQNSGRNTEKASEDSNAMDVATIKNIAIAGDGKHVAARAYPAKPGVNIFEPINGRWVLSQSIPLVADPIFSPDGQYLVMKYFSDKPSYASPVAMVDPDIDKIKIYGKSDGIWKLIQTIDDCADARFSPDGEYLFMGYYLSIVLSSNHTTCKIYKAPKNKNNNEKWVPVQDTTIDMKSIITFSPHGRYLAALRTPKDTTESGFDIYEVRQGKWTLKESIKWPYKLFYREIECAISDDGILVCAFNSDYIYTYGPAAGKWTRCGTLDLPEKQFGHLHLSGISGNANYIAYALSNDFPGCIVLYKRNGYDFEKHKIIPYLNFRIDACIFSPDSKKIAIYGMDKDDRFAVKIIYIDE